MKRILKYIFIILLVSIILFNYNVVLASTIVNNTINNANQSKENSLQTNTAKSEDNINENVIKEEKDKTQNTTKNEVAKQDKKLEEKEEVQATKITKSKKTIENGIYKIETILNNRPAFDITDGSKEDGALIQLWDYANSKQQKFEFTYQADGYYRIKSMHSGKVLAVKNNDVIQKTEKGTDDEKWIITDEKDGTYSISSKSNGLNIDIPDYNAVNGQKVKMHYKNGTEAQKFNIVEQDKKLQNGIYKIQSILNYKPAFDITDGSFEDKAQIQLWDYVNAEQQKYEVTADKDEYYKIKSVYTGKVLAVENNNVGNGTKIIQKTEKGTDDEKWNLNYQGNNEYTISSKINGLNIDIPDYNAVNGQKLQMHYGNNTEAQRFVFSKETTQAKPFENGDYTINSVFSAGKALDITDGSKENGAKIQIWSYVGAEQQKFNLEYLGDGYYKIISKYSGKALTIENQKVLGSCVIQKDYANLDSQKWQIKLKSGDRYSILSKDGAYALEVENGTDGAELKMNYRNGTAKQEFSFYARRRLIPKKTIENGIYKIESILNSRPAFDITDGSKADGAKIQLWGFVNAEQQKFEITCDNNGYYEIKSVYSEKVLAIENNKASNGISIIQKTKQGTDDEKWIINSEGNGTYSINSKINNSSIDVPEYNAVDGQKLQLHDWNGETAQKFTFTKVKKKEKLKDGTYRITMFSNEKLSFDIDAGKRENGANLQLWSWAGENSYQQQFKLIYDSTDNTYVIYNINSGKVLDVQNASYTPGANVWQYEYNGTDAQKWYIEQNNDNSYNIKSKLNGLYLDIADGKLADGGNVQVYSYNGTNAQKFNFIAQTEKSIRYVPDGLYRIATKSNNNLGFDITDGSKNEGAQIQLWDYVGAAQEEFRLYYEGGYYYIYSSYSDKVIQAGKSNEILTQAKKNTSKDTQKWILQPNGDSYNIISKATGLYIDVVDGIFKNGTKVQTHYGNGNVAQLFKFEQVGISINENKYPGYKQKITQLRQQHPNWEFELLYTGLDFNTAVTGEYEYANKQANLVYTPTYKGDWIASNPYVSETWASASYKGIAYFMDPRNFLNDVDVFQFVDLGNYASSGATKESIQYQVNGTFLNNYAEDLRRICENNNVNPYYIIARLFQEQGRNGSATLEMDGGDGKKYYNPFNIGAVVGNDVATALARAKKEGWDTMVKGLEGGMKIVKSGYIDVKQHTLYLNKFDVNPASGGGFYNHQYMQNLSAAYSEADILRSCYVDTNTLDNKIKFVIPVFENMPTTVSEKPTGQGESQIPSDKGPISVKVVDTDMGLALRTEASTSGSLIERMPTGSVLCSIERLSNGWHKVIAPSGNIGYCSDSNLQIIADETNCNDRVKVETKDNSGTNVRTGPGTSYPIIRAVGEGTVGTRIMTNKYNYEGYSWDIVVFEDGTKGFVATNYLVKID